MSRSSEVSQNTCISQWAVELNGHTFSYQLMAGFVSLALNPLPAKEALGEARKSGREGLHARKIVINLL